MKTGCTLEELARELLDRQEHKRDFHARTKTLNMLPTAQFRLETKDEEIFMPATAHAHAQMASKLNLPKVYYGRMLRQCPDLLAQNVNHWLGRSEDTSLIRVLHEQMRAVLSDRYRIVDHHDILAIVLSELGEMGDGMKVVSCQVTESRMCVKVINTNIEEAISVGDPVQAGFTLSNSEIGNGSVGVEPFIYRLVCTNGMIIKDARQRKNHVGRVTENNDLYAIDTLQAIDDAFKLKLRDLIRNAVSISTFKKAVEDMRAAKDDKIVGQTTKAVELTAKAIGLNGDESSKVLEHLIRSGDLSRYGMLNAVTRTAEDLPCYDRATELERMGSSVLYLPWGTWHEVATAGI